MDRHVAHSQNDPGITQGGIAAGLILRRCVRLDPELAKALAEHCSRTGNNPSSVIRGALRRVLSSDRDKAIAKSLLPLSPVQAQAAEDTTVETGQGDNEPLAERTAGVTAAEFPRDLLPLCRTLSSFGAASWKERRARLVGAIALAQNCWQLSQEPRDAAILADFLDLAKKHRMLD